MRSTKSKFIILLAALILCLMVASASAEIKTFTHTVKQPFGGSQSPDDARIGALAKAKREVLEKAGTYLESLTIVQNYTVERDEILALAAGVLKTDIVSQENYATEDAFGVIITAKIEVDTSILEERIEKLMQDQSLLEKNKEAQQQIEELLAKNKQLEEENRKLTASASPQRQEELRKQFKTVGRELAAAELIQQSLSGFRSGRFADPKQALEYLNRAIDVDANSARAYVLRGLAYQQLGMHREAIDDCDRAIRLRPKSDRAYLARGTVYKNLGRYDLAVSDFTRSLRLNPKAKKAYVARGAAYLQAGKRRKACADFKKACQSGACEALKRAVQRGVCPQPKAKRRRPAGNRRR